MNWMRPMDRYQFAYWLRTVRRLREVSPQSVAIQAGIPIQTYLDLEAGTRQWHLTRAQVAALSKALGMSVSRVLTALRDPGTPR